MNNPSGSQSDVTIVSEETVETSIARHRVWSSKISVVLGLVIIAMYALLGAVVLMWAFYLGKDPPSWATAVESSAITAALAVVFKDQLPGKS